MGAESPKEECGLFGVWAPGDDVARLTYFGLFAQQHRGQESAGIAVADDHNILVYKDLGLVSQVFNEATLTTLHGDLAVGHTRYSTTGSNTWDNAQPVFKTDGVHSLALGHNGNLVNTPELAATVGISGGATTDTDVVTTMIVQRDAGGGRLGGGRDARAAIADRGVLLRVHGRAKRLRGARSARVPAAVDRAPAQRLRRRLRDLRAGHRRRDVRPRRGAGGDGPHRRSRAAQPCGSRRRRRGSLCVFEYVYLARPDSRLRGRTVHEARREMGRRLALESPAEADMVIAVPTTSHSAAQGFSEVSGLPYGDGLYKNNYVGRTFIQPSQSLRDLGVKLKLNPLPDSIRGKRLVVVDDSIVRGTTTKQVVQMLREAGATAVHIRITCPPIQWPCFYGIDMPTRQELIGADLTVEQIRSYVGADSLGLSLPRRDGRGGGRRRRHRFLLQRVLRRPVPGPRARGRGQVRAGRSAAAADLVSGAYRAAGVDTEAAAKAVGLIAELAASTRRPEVADTLGGFAGLFDIGGGQAPGGRHRRRRDEAGDRAPDRPSPDRRHRSGGDVRRRHRLCRRRAAVLPRLPGGRAGGARAGRRAGRGRGRGMPPGRLRAARWRDGRAPRHDARGPVRPGRLLRRRRRRTPRCSGPSGSGEGDVLVGLASSGLHANGYSLVRRALLDGRPLDAVVPELGRPLADELLEPCTIHAPVVLDLHRRGLLHAAAHVTGGGLAENVPRMLPEGLGARLDRGTWTEPAIFGLLQREADLSRRTISSPRSTWGSGCSWPWRRSMRMRLPRTDPSWASSRPVRACGLSEAHHPS